MDDQNGKKAACWKKSRTFSPTFNEVLGKLEELRESLQDERRTLQVHLEDARVPEEEAEEDCEVVEDSEEENAVNDG